MGSLGRSGGFQGVAMEGYRDEIGEHSPLAGCHSSRSVHQACGFEMLYQESKNRSDAVKVSSEANVRETSLAAFCCN